MKIVYVVESVNLSGGYDRIIIEKANYFAEHGHDVTITVSSHSLGEPYYPVSEKLKLVDFQIDFHQLACNKSLATVLLILYLSFLQIDIVNASAFVCVISAHIFEFIVEIYA